MRFRIKNVLKSEIVFFNCLRVTPPRCVYVNMFNPKKIYADISNYEKSVYYISPFATDDTSVCG